jgi:DNA-binding phage protein
VADKPWFAFVHMCVDPSLDLDWQLSAIQTMADFVRDFEDPDDAIYQWMDEAGEPDTTYLVWALGVWKQVRTMSSIMAESVALAARELRRAETHHE